MILVITFSHPDNILSASLLIQDTAEFWSHESGGISFYSLFLNNHNKYFLKHNIGQYSESVNLKSSSEKKTLLTAKQMFPDPFLIAPVLQGCTSGLPGKE